MLFSVSFVVDEVRDFLEVRAVPFSAVFVRVTAIDILQQLLTGSFKLPRFPEDVAHLFFSILLEGVDLATPVI